MKSTIIARVLLFMLILSAVSCEHTRFTASHQGSHISTLFSWCHIFMHELVQVLASPLLFTNHGWWLAGEQVSLMLLPGLGDTPTITSKMSENNQELLEVIEDIEYMEGEMEEDTFKPSNNTWNGPELLQTYQTSPIKHSLVYLGEMLEHFSHDQCGLNDQDDDGDDDRDDNGDDDGDDGGDDDGGLLWSVVLRVCIECSALYDAYEECKEKLFKLFDNSLRTCLEVVCCYYELEVYKEDLFEYRWLAVTLLFGIIVTGLAHLLLLVRLECKELMYRDGCQCPMLDSRTVG